MKKIEFQNLPNTDTPITAENLNLIQSNIEEVFNGKEPMGSIVVEDIKSKNLLNKDEFIGAYYSSDGTLNESKENALFNQIEINGNAQYTFSIVQSVKSYAFVFFDENNTFISRLQQYNTTSTITTPSNAKYLRIFINYNGVKMTQSIIDMLQPQLKKGSTITEYTPFKKYGYNSIESMGKIVVDDINCKNIAQNPIYTSATNQYRSLVSASYLLKAGETYTISFDTDNSGLEVYRQSPSSLGFDSLSVYSWKCDGTRKSMTGVATSDGFFDNVSIISRSSATSNVSCGISNLQIAKGTDIDYTPYKKFGYNSQESMGKIVVDDIECKNLWLEQNLNTNANSYNDGKYTYSNSSSNILINTNSSSIGLNPCLLTTGEKITWSFEIYTPSDFTINSSYLCTSKNGSQVKNYGHDGISVKTGTNKIYFTDTIIYDLDNLGIVLYGSIPAGTTVSKIQIEKGSVATNYVPYKEFSNNVHTKKIWNGNFYTIGSGSTQLFNEILEIGKLYLFVVQGLSANFKMTIPYIHGSGNSIQYSYYDGTTVARWRIVINSTATGFYLDESCMNMGNNTGVLNVYKVV